MPKKAGDLYDVDTFLKPMGCSSMTELMCMKSQGNFITGLICLFYLRIGNRTPSSTGWR